MTTSLLWKTEILARPGTSAHRIARSTSRAFAVLVEFASSDAAARGSGPQSQEALRDAIEQIWAWRGPAAECARPHLEHMRELLGQFGIDHRLRPLAVAVRKAFGFTEERIEGVDVPVRTLLERGERDDGT